MLDKKEEKQKYSKFLNNTLGISSRDNSVFYKINDNKNFDILSKIEKKHKNIFKKNFKIQLNDNDLKELINDISSAEAKEEYYDALKKHGINITNYRKKIIEADFLLEQEKQIEKYETRYQKSYNFWIRLDKQISDIVEDSSIWPFFIGTFFIKMSLSSGKKIYAPLLIKQCKLKFENNNKIYLQNTEDKLWKINEKLIFFLKNEEINIGMNNEQLEQYQLNDEDSDEQVINKIIKHIYLSMKPNNLMESITIDNLLSKFVNQNSKDVVNKEVNITPGVVFGIMHPSGGVLRKILKRLIDEDKIEDVVDTVTDNTIITSDIDNDFENNPEIWRMRESNYSQDYAIQSSLKYDTIIWGPPGTGKSQVITNILINLLKNDNSALVVSEKKAALDVIGKRLGDLSMFAFDLTKQTKEEFYKPLKAFIGVVSNYVEEPEIEKEDYYNEEVFSNLRKINKIKTTNDYDNLKKMNQLFNNSGIEFNNEIYETINFLIRIKQEQKYEATLYLNKHVHDLIYDSLFFVKMDYLLEVFDSNEYIKIKELYDFLEKSKINIKLFMEIINFYKNENEIMYPPLYNKETFFNDFLKINDIKKKILFNSRWKHAKTFSDKISVLNLNNDFDIKYWIDLINAIDEQKVLHYFEFEISIFVDEIKNKQIDIHELLNKYGLTTKNEVIEFANKNAGEFINAIEENSSINNLIEIFELISKENIFLFQELEQFDKESKERIILKEDELVDYFGKKYKELIKKKCQNKDYEIKYKKFMRAVSAGRYLSTTFMKKHSEIIYSIFKIIIATREIQFNPDDPPLFDYVIIDEASQMYTEIGLPILSLGKIKIIAGDEMQMKPVSWFSSRDDTDDDELEEGETALSILDYVKDQNINRVMLDQNFRSEYAELMSFSSKHFYESNLEVIDKLIKKEKIKNKTKKYDNLHPIEVFDVNGIWEKSINKKEAFKVIELAKQYINIYDSMIILTLNSQQMKFIEDELFNDPELEKSLHDRKIMIKNLENIQGDEADIVIVSIAYDKTTKFHSTYVGRSGGQNSLNVAISRAKQKMIVVKSLNSSEIHSNSDSQDLKIFKNWIRFLEESSKTRKEYSKIEIENNGIDSSFEEEVLNELTPIIKKYKNMKIVTQFAVGSKRIDIAIFRKNEYLIGIEVDGYKYHKGFQKYLKDKSREEFLNSKGYDIYRIKEIDWTNNKEGVLREIEIIISPD